MSTMAVNQVKEEGNQSPAAQTDDSQVPSVIDRNTIKADPPPNGGSAAWL
jgi:hypothetical protein